MDVRQLKLFLAVLECCSITKAAERVHLSPGAVSWQLHNLASELHTDLFLRSGKIIVPTSAALRLSGLAQGVLQQMRQIEQEFGDDPSTDTLPFHFGTSGTELVNSLGRPLRLLRKRFPNTPLEITVAGTEQMVRGLISRQLDLALISLPVDSQILNLETLFEEELLIVKPSPTRVPGWQIRAIKPQDLEPALFVLYPKGSVVRKITDCFFQDIGLTPRVAMEADDAQAIKRLVETGFGWSILPEPALRGHQRFFHMFRLPGHTIVRAQALATARTDYPRALTELIRKFLRDAIMEMR